MLLDKQHLAMSLGQARRHPRASVTAGARRGGSFSAAYARGDAEAGNRG
jgi:hypothetical protein